MKEKKGSEALQEKPFRAYIPVVFALMYTVFIAGGFSGTSGIFMPLLADTYSVNVSDISIYMTIGGIIMAVGGPLLGRAFVKFPVKICGAALMLTQTIAYVIFAMSITVEGVVLAGVIQYAFVMLLVSLYVPTVINRWFKDCAGTILGLSAAMTGAGGALWLIVAQSIIDSLGYQACYWMFAVACLTCVPFVLFVVGDKPSDKGMLAYVNTKSIEKAESAESAVEAKNWSVDPSLAVKSAPFWLVVLFIACCQGGVKVANFFPTYVNSVAELGGAVFISGAMLSSLVMVGQAIFKVVIGMSSDATSPHKALFIGAGAGAIAIILIWQFVSTPLLAVGGLIFGLYYGCPAVLMPLVGGYIFGTGPNFSVIWGRALLPSGILMAPFTSIWPLIAENFGGYGSAFAGVLVCLTLCVFFGSLAMKLGEKLPHITVAVGGPIEAQIGEAEIESGSASAGARTDVRSQGGLRPVHEGASN